MTESDVLARAARALREAHTGEREGSGFTRARIMNTLHYERRRRTLRWAIFSPIASVLLVGSAWAQSSGKWPVIWKTVASVFVAAPTTEPAPAQRSAPREKASPAQNGLPPPSPAIADAGTAELAAPAALEPEKAEARPRKPVRRRMREAPASTPSPSSVQPEPSAPALDTPAEPERDRELGRFRRAHDLHFKGRAGEAIAAYSEYLQAYPDGRFVPEARYAMALDQIKLGNDAAARDLLAPFAAGRYGGYRQKEARTLLEALEKKLEKSKRHGR